MKVAKGSRPFSRATLARVFETTPAKIKESVIDYSIIYNNMDVPRGVILLTYADSCQLCTKKYYLNEIREALGIKKSGTLSTSSMEALAIVAYNQPVTRAFVDTLRRVDSSYAMNSLIDRGLIASKGRLDVPGRPMLYGTTSDFLRCFGLEDLSGLPKTSEELIETFQNAKNESNALLDDSAILGGEQISVDIESALPDSTEIAPKVDETISEVEAVMDEPSAEDDIIEE